MKAKLFFILIGFLMVVQVQAHVALVYPNGGETFNPGETINIQWEIVVSHNTLNWDLYISEDGGNSWEPLKLDISVDSLNYHWEVPDKPTTQGKIRVVMDNGGGNYMDNSDNFTITTITGINDFENEINYNVYPNPMAEIAFLSFENKDFKSHRVILYNLSGEAVFESNSTTTDKIEIVRNGLPAGLYFFQILLDGNPYGTGKIIMN